MYYVKRYRMELLMRNWRPAVRTLPAGYQLVAWHPDLIDVHAQAKYRSFRDEIDSKVFPCLGDLGGCRRLMEDIANRMGFCPEATWLVRWDGRSPVNRPAIADGDLATIDGDTDDSFEYCGTIQGVRDGYDLGGVQNLGISPDHRGRGLGTTLLLQSLDGFWSAGARRVFLEVTAINHGAVRLYQRLGFRCSKTVYKAVDVPIEESEHRVIEALTG